MNWFGEKKRKRWQRATIGKIQSREDTLAREQALSNWIARTLVAATLTALVVLLVVARRQREIAAIGGRLPLAMLAGLIVVGNACAWLGMIRFFPEVFRTVASFYRFAALIASFLLISKLVFFLGGLIAPDSSAYKYLAPLPLLAPVLAMAYSHRVAVYVTVGAAGWLGLMSPDFAAGVGAQGLPILPIDGSLTVASGLGGLVAITATGAVRTQSRPVAIGVYAGAAQFAAILAIRAMALSGNGGGSDALPGLRQVGTLLADPVTGLANGIVCGGILTCLLPSIERIFAVVTDRRLLELADPATELLRTLLLRAPGSFTHSQTVAHLAAEAAEAVGANPLLARVGSYYHDIGKILKPDYFIENIQTGISPHERLSPEMSRLVIISHVKDGVRIAEEEKLPPNVVDMIGMHHGTCVVEYFYAKAKSLRGDQIEPDIESYRYPGPKPTFKEAAILMLADAVEAATRAIPEPTASRLIAKVEEITNRRLMEGQLDASELTMHDLRKITDSFIRTLSTQIFHGRIQYPKTSEGKRYARGAAAQATGAPSGPDGD
ncbi:MAG: HDIG domain-containing protein [Planctomycetes bacterium]|nr:HDIG domain-containing protein [Planctomycetota bacterium]